MTTDSNATTGAVALGECPNRGRRFVCTCSPCAECQHGKHTAVHGPKIDALPGSEPWGHEYVPPREAAQP